MLTSLFRSPVFVALLVVAPGCTCDEPSRVAPPAPAPTPSAEPACTPLPPVEAWAPVGAEFFEARLPPSFKEAKMKEGKGYRDDAAKRRIQFSEIELPTAGMDVTAAIDKLNEGVRGQASDPELALKLGPTRHGGTARDPVRYFRVTAPDRTFVQGLVGRIGATGRLHAVLVIYEDEGPAATPSCMERDGRALMETVSIPVGFTGSASASAGPVAPPAPLTLTAAAVEELKRQLKPGETVWMGVNRDGAEYSYLLDVGDKVPPDAEKMMVQGIPIAVDRGSLPFLSGTTIDFVDGAGFKFDNPNVRKPGAD